MSGIPKRYARFMSDHPAVGSAYKALGKATMEAGPLDAKSACLVKIGISAGARMEGALKSHIRKALGAGASPDEVRHALLLTTTTIGFPNMMAAMAWSDEVLEAHEQD